MSASKSGGQMVKHKDETCQQKYIEHALQRTLNNCEGPVNFIFLTSDYKNKVSESKTPEEEKDGNGAPLYFFQDLTEL